MEYFNIETNTLVYVKIDIERTFSVFKYMYSNREHKFFIETFKEH